jgi:hypothetical protein
MTPFPSPAGRPRAALLAQGACNPAGLAHTLIEWQRTILDAPGRGTDDVTADPACRLLAYYLAELMNVGVGFDDRAFSELQQACWRQAGADEQRAAAATL